MACPTALKSLHPILSSAAMEAVSILRTRQSPCAHTLSRARCPDPGSAYGAARSTAPCPPQGPETVAHVQYIIHSVKLEVKFGKDER